MIAAQEVGKDLYFTFRHWRQRQTKTKQQMARVMKEIANRTPRATAAPAIETNSRKDMI